MVRTGSSSRRPARAGHPPPARDDDVVLSEEALRRLVLEFTKSSFSEARKDLRHRHTLCPLDVGVHVGEAPTQLPRQYRANTRLPGPHEAHEQYSGGIGPRHRSPKPRSIRYVR